MKPTSEILERIEKCSSEHKDGVFTRLYRYLLREDIYYAAYQKLYANKGATTQGIDNDTADGFSDFYVKELIQSLKDGTYKANPVRREYIPKKNGKLRPLGIPSFHDKLLQEVVRMILESMNLSLTATPTVSDRVKAVIPHSVRFLLTSQAWSGLSRAIYKVVLITSITKN